MPPPQIDCPNFKIRQAGASRDTPEPRPRFTDVRPRRSFRARGRSNSPSPDWLPRLPTPPGSVPSHVRWHRPGHPRQANISLVLIRRLAVPRSAGYYACRHHSRSHHRRIHYSPTPSRRAPHSRQHALPRRSAYRPVPVADRRKLAKFLSPNNSFIMTIWVRIR
jgi:hypothetical protein